jgi:hypothetical protein
MAQLEARQKQLEADLAAAPAKDAALRIHRKRRPRPIDFALARCRGGCEAEDGR